MHVPALKMWWNDNTAKVLDLCWGIESRLWTCFSVAVCPPYLVTWRCHLLSLSLHSKVTRRWSIHLLLVLSLCSGVFCSLMLMWRDLLTRCQSWRCKYLHLTVQTTLWASVNHLSKEVCSYRVQGLAFFSEAPICGHVKLNSFQEAKLL